MPQNGLDWARKYKQKSERKHNAAHKSSQTVCKQMLAGDDSAGTLDERFLENERCTHRNNTVHKKKGRKRKKHIARIGSTTTICIFSNSENPSQQACLHPPQCSELLLHTPCAPSTASQARPDIFLFAMTQYVRRPFVAQQIWLPKCFEFSKKKKRLASGRKKKESNTHKNTHAKTAKQKNRRTFCFLSFATHSAQMAVLRCVATHLNLVSRRMIRLEQHSENAQASETPL